MLKHFYNDVLIMQYFSDPMRFATLYLKIYSFISLLKDEIAKISLRKNDRVFC
jgi:hypothetical protein